jgi:hypothetical protein
MEQTMFSVVFYLVLLSLLPLSAAVGLSETAMAVPFGICLVMLLAGPQGCAHLAKSWLKGGAK